MLALAVGIFVVSPRPRAAQAETSNAALAESLFVDARRLMAAGDLDAACPKFEASQKLDPQLGTLLNLGQCYERSGQTASAWATFTELSRLAERAGQAKRAAYASERVDALAPNLSYLVVSLTTRAPGTRIHIDDVALDDAALGSPLPFDPGPHRVTLNAPGHRPFAREFQVVPRARTILELPALVPVAPPPIPLPKTPAVTVPRPPPRLLLPPPPAPAPASESTVPASPWWTPAITGYAVAGAGAVVGTVTGVLALSESGGLDCPMEVCPPSQADRLSRANTLGDTANVAFAVAGVGAVLGIVATILAVDDDEASTATSFRGSLFRF